MAGSWATVTITDAGIGGHLNGVKRFEALFTADATDAENETPPQLQIGSVQDDYEFGGFLQRYSVLFGATAPTGASFTVQIADKNGVIIGNADGTALTGTSTITVNAYFVGPLYVIISGNETNSAQITVSAYVS